MDQQHQQQAPEQHYAGLDVSLDATSVCILDAQGTVVWRGTCALMPEAGVVQNMPFPGNTGRQPGQIPGQSGWGCSLTNEVGERRNGDSTRDV